MIAIEEKINKTIEDYDEYRLQDAVEGATYLIGYFYENGYAGRSYRDFLSGYCGDLALMLYNIFNGEAEIYTCEYHAVCKIGDRFYDANPYDITNKIKPLINKEYFLNDLHTEEGRDRLEYFIGTCRNRGDKDFVAKHEAEMKTIEEEVKKSLKYEYIEPRKLQ